MRQHFFSLSLTILDPFCTQDDSLSESSCNYRLLRLLTSHETRQVLSLNEFALTRIHSYHYLALALQVHCVNGLGLGNYLVEGLTCGAWWRNKVGCNCCSCCGSALTDCFVQ